MTSASWYTTFAQRSFQCDLDCKAGTVHRQHVRWRGDEAFGEKIDRGLYTIRQLRASKMQATHNLQPMGDRLAKERQQRTMYIGRENRLIASLTTFTIPACEQLFIAVSLGIPI